MLSTARIIGHKEWAYGRKSDPVYNMQWRRNRVAAFTPNEEDIDMATGDEILQVLHGYGRRVELLQDEVAALRGDVTFVADQLGGPGWREGDWGWLDKREPNGDSSDDVKLTLVDYLREIDARLVKVQEAVEDPQ